MEDDNEKYAVDSAVYTVYYTKPTKSILRGLVFAKTTRQRESYGFLNGKILPFCFPGMPPPKSIFRASSICICWAWLASAISSNFDSKSAIEVTEYSRTCSWYLN